MRVFHRCPWSCLCFSLTERGETIFLTKVNASLARAEFNILRCLYNIRAIVRKRASCAHWPIPVTETAHLRKTLGTVTVIIIWSLVLCWAPPATASILISPESPWFHFVFLRWIHCKRKRNNPHQAKALWISCSCPRVCWILFWPIIPKLRCALQLDCCG